uniref:Uncharacterized protein n=1 Tax=Anopheles culicifacies TaxID=139723 RepID=A0A182MEY2_9DIPT
MLASRTRDTAGTLGNFRRYLTPTSTRRTSTAATRATDTDSTRAHVDLCSSIVWRIYSRCTNTLLTDHGTILGGVNLTILQGRLKVMWMVMHHVQLVLLLLLLNPTAHAFLRLGHSRDRGELLHHRIVAEGALNRKGCVPCLHSTVLALQQFDLLVQQILRQFIPV